MTAQHPHDRLSRLRLAAYGPGAETRTGGPGAGGEAAAGAGAGAGEREAGEGPGGGGAGGGAGPAGGRESGGDPSDPAGAGRHRNRQPARARAWSIRPAVTARLGLAVVLVVLVALVVLAVGLLRDGDDPPPQVTLPVPNVVPSSAAPANGEAPTEGEAGANGEMPADGETSAGAQVYVHVAGAVAEPGLVHLAEGARVADAISAAGGAARGADLDRVNLAAVLIDGEQVYVPTEGEDVPAVAQPGTGEGGGADQGSNAVVNMNTAGAQELATLPGIGPAKAADIIAWREDEGPFASVEDLLQVPGIGPATLERLRDRVRV